MYLPVRAEVNHGQSPRLRQRQLPVLGLHIREEVGVKSAWAQAFLKRSSASAA